MCYERLFFKSWAKQKTQKRTEIPSDVQRVSPNIQPIRPVSRQETQGRKEVKREIEEIV
jgi:hypothetical protein